MDRLNFSLTFSNWSRLQMTASRKIVTPCLTLLFLVISATFSKQINSDSSSFYSFCFFANCSDSARRRWPIRINNALINLLIDTFSSLFGLPSNVLRALNFTRKGQSGQSPNDAPCQSLEKRERHTHAKQKKGKIFTYIYFSGVYRLKMYVSNFVLFRILRYQQARTAI